MKAGILKKTSWTAPAKRSGDGAIARTHVKQIYNTSARTNAVWRFASHRSPKCAKTPSSPHQHICAPTGITDFLQTFDRCLTTTSSPNC